jgi:hypothetical protein
MTILQIHMTIMQIHMKTINIYEACWVHAIVHFHYPFRNSSSPPSQVSSLTQIPHKHLTSLYQARVLPMALSEAT